MFLMKKELEFFARKLRAIREAKGLSQLELAKRSNVQLRMYSRYENGDSAPTLPVIVKLVETLEVSADFLISPNHVGINGIEDKKLLSFMEKIDKLDYQTKYVVQEILEGILLKQSVKLRIGENPLTGDS